MRFPGLLFFFLIPGILFCQQNIAVFETDLDENPGFFEETQEINRSLIEGITSTVVSFYSNIEEFNVIDKTNEAFITEELERQKDEAFMDGYIVDQGKRMGADYLLFSKYDHKASSVSFRLMDVTTGKAQCSSQAEVDRRLGVIKDLEESVRKALYVLNERCFEQYVQAVKCEESKKGKCKSLLILAGHKQKVNEKDQYEIIIKQEEKINDQTILRSKVVGEGEIDSVEDDNFSILKISDGEEEILNYLNKGQKVYLKYINK